MEKRRSNIELLRVILPLMIIVLHFNHADMPGGGGASLLIAAGSYRFYLMQFTEALCCCAVNVFALITGYFMIEKNSVVVNKVIVLFFRLIVYNIIFYALCCLLVKEPFSSRTAFYRIIPTNYYIILYAVLFVFSPFINKMFNSLSEKNLDKLMIIVAIVFLIQPTVVNFYQDIAKVRLTGVYTYSINGDDAGYNIVHFAVMYLIGGYIKKKDLFNKLSAKWYALIYLGVSILIVFLSRFFPSVFYYNNILVVIEAVALFKVFDSFKIKTNKIINSLGGFSLDIFLIHTNALFIVYFWEKFQIANNYSTLEFSRMFSFTLFTTVSMYVVCLAVAAAYKLIFQNTLEKLILKRPIYRENLDKEKGLCTQNCRAYSLKAS